MTPLPGFTMVFTMRGPMSLNNLRWMTEALPKGLATRGGGAMTPARLRRHWRPARMSSGFRARPPACMSATLRRVTAVPERSGARKDHACGDTSRRNRPVSGLATFTVGRRRDHFSAEDRPRPSGRGSPSTTRGHAFAPGVSRPSEVSRQVPVGSAADRPSGRKLVAGQIGSPGPTIRCTKDVARRGQWWSVGCVNAARCRADRGQQHAS